MKITDIFDPEREEDGYSRDLKNKGEGYMSEPMFESRDENGAARRRRWRKEYDNDRS